MTWQRARFTRRGLLQTTGAVSVASALGVVAGACGRPEHAAAEVSSAQVKLPPFFAASERESGDMPAPLPWNKRVGVAIVGLGHLALDQILPAFAQSKLCKPVALVSGDAGKASRVGAQYGIEAKSIYDYKTYDRLKDDAAVQVVYVVLPNSMHAEYTVRAAQAGKHVLCEKPMATSVADCEHMIAACKAANKQLMIAYRMQYEPYNREVIRLARAGEIGKIKALSATNGQNQGDPKQWRLKRALAGGGALPDLGIYCLNAARYLSGEEPTEVQAMQYSTPNDPRFAEVEEEVSFTLRFPSGFLASCVTSYGVHDSKRFRLLGETGWVELDPAFPYVGQSMRLGRKRPGTSIEDVDQPRLDAKNQFALELDHMAGCVQNNQRPHTPGEEGMQDMRVIAAIYEAAQSGNTVKLPTVAGLDAFRGPAPS
jgi:predicted dehydrogenase